MIEPIFEGETGVLIGTGPSLNTKQLRMVHEANVRVFTVNNAYQVFPWTDVHLAVNDNWWRYYFPRDPLLATMKCPRYTWYKDIADDYQIDYIKAIVKDGLSHDPNVVHINHGSGPMMVNVAALYGIKKLILIGHDMKFAPDYNGRTQTVGSSPRHYFGEYPKEMQHWPSVKIGKSAPGVIDGLIEAYDKMHDDLFLFKMEVVNCTPGSALNSFPKSVLEDEL